VNVNHVINVKKCSFCSLTIRSLNKILIKNILNLNTNYLHRLRVLVSDDTAKLDDSLHIVDRALNFVVNERELRLWQHHVVHTVHRAGDEMAQVLVHKLTQEGGERSHHACH
jgi:hypothetical protein